MAAASGRRAATVLGLWEGGSSDNPVTSLPLGRPCDTCDARRVPTSFMSAVPLYPTGCPPWPPNPLGESMKKFITAVAAVALVGASVPAAAQDAGDVAAFFALTSTPYGALPAVHSQSNPGFALDVRYGRFSIDALDMDVSTIGLGGNFNLAGGRMGIMLGRQTAADVDGSTTMGGVDYNRNLMSAPVGASTTTSFNLGLHPAFGYGKASEGDASAMSFAVDMPASISIGTKSGMQIVSFLAPGFGYGRLAEGDENESGTRAAIGGGVGLLNIGGGLGVNLGFRKIFLEEAPTQWGLGLSWSR